jgi:hypothetical protein
MPSACTAELVGEVGEVGEHGHRLVRRVGRALAGTIITVAGAVDIQAPGSTSARIDPATGGKAQFKKMTSRLAVGK